jgi:hypothetical protein
MAEGVCRPKLVSASTHDLFCSAPPRSRATKPNRPLKQSDRRQRQQPIGSTPDLAARAPARHSLNVDCAVSFARFLGFSEPLQLATSRCGVRARTST